MARAAPVCQWDGSGQPGPDGKYHHLDVIPCRSAATASYGQHFAGLIDEVRVYNAALKPTDIQADMATPLGNHNLARRELGPLQYRTSETRRSALPAVPPCVTLTNTGGGTLSINNITVTGSQSADFAQTNKCPAASLAVNASCTIGITFTPTVAAHRSAIVAITDNAPGTPQTIR